MGKKERKKHKQNFPTIDVRFFRTRDWWDIIPGSAVNRRDMCGLAGGSTVLKKIKAYRKYGSNFINNFRGRHDK
jgi:hypothetical protein